MFTTSYKYSLLLLAFAAGITLSGCKKDKTTAPATITGTWVNAENRFTNPDYYNFTGDGHMYLLNKTYGGFNRIAESIYSFSGSQLILTDNSSTRLYNTVISGDTLFLNDGASNYRTLLKSPTAPTLADWATVLTPQQSFIDTLHVTGITFYNNKIYSFKQIGGADKLIEFSTTLNRVTAITPSDDTYDGIDFAPDGTLWTSHWAYAYKFDIASGSQYFQSAATPSSSSAWAVAYGSGKLYALRGNTISSYIFNSDSWQTESNIEISMLTDIAYADGYVYMVADGILYKMVPGNSLPSQTYYLPGFTLKGIAYAGNGVFWVNGQNRLTSNYEINKVTIN